MREWKKRKATICIQDSSLITYVKTIKIIFLGSFSPGTLSALLFASITGRIFNEILSMVISRWSDLKWTWLYSLCLSVLFQFQVNGGYSFIKTVKFQQYTDQKNKLHSLTPVWVYEECINSYFPTVYEVLKPERRSFSIVLSTKVHVILKQK